MKVLGGTMPSTRMMPAHQGFKPRDLVSLQLDNRLVVEFQLPLGDRRA